MARLFEFFKTLNSKLSVEVNSLDSLRYVMMVLKEVREKESSIEMEISPIMDMYFILDHYLPGNNCLVHYNYYFSCDEFLAITRWSNQ